MSNIVVMQDRTHCQHAWREEYYGWKCINCRLFYAFGTAPLEFAEDKDFDTFDGEDEYMDKDE